MSAYMDRGTAFDGAPASRSDGLPRSVSTPVGSSFLTTADLQRKLHSCLQFARGNSWRKDAVGALHLPPCLDGAQAMLFTSDHTQGLHRKIVTSLPGLSASALAWMLFSPELSRAGLLDMGGSEVRWFGLLDVPDERSYFSYSEALVDGQLECGVFYSCLLPIEGGWAVVRFTAEHLAVPDFHMAQWPARTRVCLVRQKGFSVGVSIATSVSYPDHLRRNTLSRHGRTQGRERMRAAEFDGLRQLGAHLMTPSAMALLARCTPADDAKGEEGGPRAEFYPTNVRSTGEELAAAYRVQLMAYYTEHGDWQPDTALQLGRLAVRVYGKRQRSGVRSLRLRTVLPSVDAESLSRLLFSDECQAYLLPNQGLATIRHMSKDTHIIRRTIPQDIRDAWAKLKPSLRAHLDGEDRACVDYCLTARRLNNGMYTLCSWKAVDPDSAESPNLWEIWLLRQQGLNVEVTLASFPRHGPDIDDEYRSGQRSIQAAADEARSRRGERRPAAAALLETGARQLADKLAGLAVLLQGEGGQEALMQHASGWKGWLMHGWASCVFRPVLCLLGRPGPAERAQIARAPDSLPQ